MSHLVVSGLSKSYGDTLVLRDISFTVERGHCVAVLGPSGSGKSTLLRCLNRLESHDAGTIEIDGTRIGPNFSRSRRQRRADLVAQRRRFGMVFQQFELFPHLTALQNVVIGQRTVSGRDRDTALARARQELDRVGLLDKQDAMPASLSGGQQQRVAIARAVAMDPEVLLFDEPTSALDPERVGEVLTVMRDIAASNITMLVVTHELDFARRAADHVLFIDGGTVLESGPPEKVLDHPAQDRTKRFLTRLNSQPAADVPV
ncbi:MAG: amino acid ABC transporter ATP-binding protein [Acidobacteriota bacterium]|nr:amino acid ABC transporter ATP-binding protein [Acidobacteriota bacterium]